MQLYISIIKFLQSLSIFIWIILFAFSILFLDSPTAKISRLWPMYIGLGVTVCALLCTIFLKNHLWIVSTAFLISMVASPVFIFRYIPKVLKGDRGQVPAVEYINESDEARDFISKIVQEKYPNLIRNGKKLELRYIKRVDGVEGEWVAEYDIPTAEDTGVRVKVNVKAKKVIEFIDQWS